MRTPEECYGHEAMWVEMATEGRTRCGRRMVTTHPSFTFGEAVPVPRPFQGAAPISERPYDISRDGQHFLGLIDAVQTQSGAPATQQIQVVLNWFEELRARVPTM